MRPLARGGYRLEKIYTLSAVAYRKGGAVCFPCQFRLDGNRSFGGRGNVCGIYAPQSVYTAFLNLYYRAYPQLRFFRSFDGNLFKRRNYVWYVRGGALRQRRHGLRRVVA